MTDQPVDGAGTEGARRLLVESEAVLEGILDSFRDMNARIERGEDVALSEVLRKKAALATARVAILDEVRRHEARVLHNEGLAAAAPIDLDAARFEIGRRLDRIRHARGAA